MSINWFEIQKSIYPMKSYEDLCRRWQESLSYSFVRRVFNQTMPELSEYTLRGVGGDPRHRYDDYAEILVNLMAQLDRAGVQNVIDLFTRFCEPGRCESLVETSGISAGEIALVMKYLTYWFLPGPKYLGSLVRLDPETSAAVKTLQEHGIRTNLDILEAGDTSAKRLTLAEQSGLPLSIINGLVNRADFSRMPWASKATISNIIGAGYGSLQALASADTEKLVTDYMQYGRGIGKNLKLGNEIENSQHMARIIPAILED